MKHELRQKDPDPTQDRGPMCCDCTHYCYTPQARAPFASAGALRLWEGLLAAPLSFSESRGRFRSPSERRVCAPLAAAHDKPQTTHRITSLRM